MWTLISLVVAAVPGVVAWWTGRRLLARRDDPTLPERVVARANRIVQTTAASVAVLVFVSPHTPWILALPLLGLHLKLPQDTDRSIDARLVGGRLAVLSGRATGGAVSVYALP